MFHVVHGYRSPDNYTSDNGPVLKLARLKTEQEVLALRQEYTDDHGVDEYDEISEFTFVVIKGGKELKAEAAYKVTEFKLS